MIFITNFYKLIVIILLIIILIKLINNINETFNSDCSSIVAIQYYVIRHHYVKRIRIIKNVFLLLK